MVAPLIAAKVAIQASRHLAAARNKDRKKSAAPNVTVPQQPRPATPEGGEQNTGDFLTGERNRFRKAGPQQMIGMPAQAQRQSQEPENENQEEEAEAMDEAQTGARLASERNEQRANTLSAQNIGQGIGKKLRELEQVHPMVAFTIATILAAFQDFFLDPLANSDPTIITYIIIFLPRLIVEAALLYFLWGRGTWKVKAVQIICSVFNMLPFVGWLPLSLTKVLYASRMSKKKVAENNEMLEEQSAQGTQAMQLSE